MSQTSLINSSAFRPVIKSRENEGQFLSKRSTSPYKGNWSLCTHLSAFYYFKATCAVHLWCPKIGLDKGLPITEFLTVPTLSFTCYFHNVFLNDSCEIEGCWIFLKPYFKVSFRPFLQHIWSFWTILEPFCNLFCLVWSLFSLFSNFFFILTSFNTF